jgi:hypothetical protein
MELIQIWLSACLNLMLILHQSPEGDVNYYQLYQCDDDCGLPVSEGDVIYVGNGLELMATDGDDMMLEYYNAEGVRMTLTFREGTAVLLMREWMWNPLLCGAA